MWVNCNSPNSHCECTPILRLPDGSQCIYDAPYFWMMVTFAPIQCERTPAIDQFFRQFSSNETTKIAAIGAGCGVATEAVAEISHYWQAPMVRCNTIHVQNSCNAQEFQHHCTVVVCKNPLFMSLPQISCQSANPVLKNTNRFRVFFQVKSYGMHSINCLIHIMLCKNWHAQHQRN